MSGDALLGDGFTITDQHLNAGLRGVPVGTCRTSSVSAQDGVSYGGYPVAELAGLPCEHVIHLLFRKELPDEDQAADFGRELGARSEVPGEVFDALAKLPDSAHPMECFVNALMLLGMTGKTPGDDFREDSLNLVARTSAVVAAIFRLKNGWGDPIPARPDLPFHENFAHMLGAPDAHPKLAELLRMFYVLHADHGGGNLSTFTGKAIASGLAHVYASMAGAMAALYGPLHGRANQECLELVKEIGTSDRDDVASFVRKRLADGGLIYGFGHAVLRAEDPRARVQYAFGEEHFSADPLVKTALVLREVVPEILKENPKIQNPYPNVDAISGSLLNAAGLTDPEFYTVLFGWSRVSGIAAQIVDERHVLRDGKGVPIYRPRYVAEEQPTRHLPGHG